MEEGNKLIKSLMSKSFGLKYVSRQIANRITEELLFDLQSIVFQASAVKDKSGCSMLMPRHVDIALKRRNFPPQYGFQCDQNKPFGLVSGGGCDLSFIEESEVDLKKFVNKYKVLEEPPEMEIHTHWFTVENVPITSQEYSTLFKKKLKKKAINPRNKTFAKKTVKTRSSINKNLNDSNFSSDSEVSENTESQNSQSSNSSVSPRSADVSTIQRRRKKKGLSLGLID